MTALSRSLACLVAAVALLAFAPAAHAGESYNFNADWRLNVGDVAGGEAPGLSDSGWKSVTLPHAWNEDTAYKVHPQPTGIAWYRKTFTVPALPADGRLLIEFEGVRQAAEVYVNGVHLGRHENGVMAFGFDLTPHVTPGQKATIAVRVDNDFSYKEKATGTAFQWNHTSFNANYGGVNRNVKLHVMGAVHQTLPLWSHLGTTGVYVFGSQYDIPGKAADVTARTQVRNESTTARTVDYRVRVKDMNGKVVKEFSGGKQTFAPGETREISASARLTGLNFWSWGYGYLYTVETALLEKGKVIDEVKTRTGFRKTAFGKGMVWLNDRVTMIHGYAARTTNEWPALGMNMPPWLSDYSNRLMVESGGNFVRWMHVTPSKQDVESSDRVGIMQAMPAGDAEADRTGRQWEQRVELMREAIIYNRNNPSIIMYESGNENISEAHMAEMKAIRDKYDPEGGRAIGSREMLDSKVAEYGGEMLYVNKSAGKPVWATEYYRDEAARAYRDAFTPPFHKDSPDYNRNQDSYAVDTAKRWYDFWRERPGGGTRVSAGGVNINWIDSNSHFRGDNNYRRSGEVDAMRLPKDAFFVNQVMWDGWVDVEKPHTYIIGHWNYAPGVVKDIHVVSSSPSVELFVNGKSLGRKDTPEAGFLFTYKQVPYAPGGLVAVSYDKAGKEASRYTIETTGEPVAIKLTPTTGPTGFKADGSDLALIDVEVVDAKGRTVPTSLAPISFEVTGPGEWRGGIAQGPGNYILAKTLPVEGGINRVIVRGTTTPGKIKVTATSAGLKSASVDFTTKAAPAPNGMTTALPGATEPSNLKRGPTPAGASYKVWREAIPIKSVTAGSNADTAKATLDDNEMTLWKSENAKDKAWIEYEFEQPATVGEVTLKLVGWRLRSYPLRITLDGRTIYEGTPEKTLGYVTLPTTALTGSRLRIELTGPTEDRDAFGQIIELVPNARAGFDTMAEQVPAGFGLAIVEAEIYKPSLK
jgi:hypothetical protein